MSDLADGASESASKKSAKFGQTGIREFDKATKSDAEEEESDAVEWPKNKARKEAEKAEKEAEKARKEAERKAEKEKKEELARQRKAVAEERKQLKHNIAVCRRSARPETRTKMLWPLHHHNDRMIT